MVVGLGLALVILTVPLGYLVTGAGVVAGVGALVVLVAALFVVRPVTRWVALTLVAVGVLALAWAMLLGARPGPAQLTSLNQGVVGMLAAVSFTRLVTVRQQESPAHERHAGRVALWRTSGLVHGLGSVINLAAVDIVGGHLGRGRPRLALLDGLLLSRSFSVAAFWSPFWASSATAIAYAPRADTVLLVLCGGVLAVLALALSLVLLQRRFPEESADYEGYAVTPRMLLLPVSLLLCVLVGHAAAPGLPVSTVVLLSALLVSVVLGARMLRGDLPRALGRHVVRGLPRLRGEAALFVAAGVLSVGLSVLVGQLGVQAPVREFTVLVAWVCVLAMTALSVVGIHPIISIAMVAVLMAPTQPDPTLFALSATIAWGASASVGPVSGLNVYLAGRFGLNGFQVARSNAGHVLLVLALALPALMLCGALVSL
ncbi:hypothetical protein [Serinicoccus kebangsaanensis]|uniref:hypothetical protein n=1 Tax=Serinicoccus kebangsaanensis TaxID=2602069 RepID=UPI00124DEAD1|nr:hypothetical protein [Serinicoccus kebangsaanensis]